MKKKDFSQSLRENQGFTLRSFVELQTGKSIYTLFF
jgi:hypothetical protein